MIPTPLDYRNPGDEKPQRFPVLFALAVVDALGLLAMAFLSLGNPALPTAILAALGLGGVSGVLIGIGSRALLGRSERCRQILAVGAGFDAVLALVILTTASLLAVTRARVEFSCFPIAVTCVRLALAALLWSTVTSDDVVAWHRGDAPRHAIPVPPGAKESPAGDAAGESEL